MDRAGPLNSKQIILQASEETPFPGDEQAGYEELFDDPQLANMPYEAPTPQGDPRFHENIAHHLGDYELSKIGNQLSQAIQADDDARQQWLRVITDCIDYLGLGNSKAKGGNNSRSSDIYAPTLLSIAVNITSKLHSNLFPAKGFVECKTFGQASEAVEDQAYRMKEFSDYMLTDVMSGYEEDKQQALFWAVICGHVFCKVYLDESKDKPAAPYIRPEDIIIDAGASSLDDAERITHRFVISDRIAEERFRTGEWKRAYLDTHDVKQDVVRSNADKVMGINNIPDETNKSYCFDECYCYLDIPSYEHMGRNGNPSGRLLPYIVIKDKNNDNVVSVKRNYKEFDRLYRRIDHIIQYKYFTGFGPYGLGLAHMALGLAKAETEIQQQLIMAGKLSNAPSLLMNNALKGERTQYNITPGSLNQMAAFGNSIQDSIMPLPFKEPSQVLLALKDQISQAMQDISAASDFTPDNIPANTGEMTMAALISSSHILEDSVMGGLYKAFAKELDLLFDVFSQWLPESPYPFSVPGGAHVIMREDFTPSVRIKPIIDPNASSSTQQMIIGETIMNLALANPDLYNMREVQKRLLNSMKVRDIDQILLPDEKEAPPPPELDAISENARVITGEAIQVYKTQDHGSHKIVHQNMIDQLSADETQDNSSKIAELQSHNSDHDMWLYLAEMQAMSGVELPEDVESIPEQIQNQISIQAAKALEKKAKEDAKDNPPPVDPNEVMMRELDVKEQELQLKAQQNQAQLELDQQKLQAEEGRKSVELQIKMKQIELEEKQLALEQMKLELQHQDMMQKLQVEMSKIQADKERSELEAKTKSYDSTLRYETDKENEAVRSDLETQKADLQAQTKAYDSTLKFEQSQKEEDELPTKKPK